MAWLNDVYVFVEKENLTHDIEAASHPVENGVDITDHIRKLPVEIDISGCIVDHDGINASDMLEKLKQMQYAGTIINYAGRNAVSGLIIEKFSTSHPNTIAGGANFSMKLKEIKIAQLAFAGNVSNDAANENAEPTNAGTQQVELGDGEKIYHTVKSGEQIFMIVRYYRELSPKFLHESDKINWIMEQNPDAFAEPGNYSSLIEGSVILVGLRDNMNDVYKSRDAKKLYFIKAGG